MFIRDLWAHDERDAAERARIVAPTRRVDSGMAERPPTVRIRPLTDPADAGLAGDTTPDERLALVEVLTREAWALMGLPVPTYERGDTPIRVVRRSASVGPASA